MNTGRAMQTAYVIASGQSTEAADDFEKILTPEGREQAVKLGKYLIESGHDFDYVVCSAAPRAQQTAGLVMQPPGRVKQLAARQETWWYNGAGREFYSFRSASDHAALLALRSKVSSDNYAALKSADKDGLIPKLRGEIRGCIFGLPRIDRARIVAIFTPLLIANIIAEALWQEHSSHVEKIDLGPCEAIVLMVDGCEYFHPLAA